MAISIEMIQTKIFSTQWNHRFFDTTYFFLQFWSRELMCYIKVELYDLYQMRDNESVSLFPSAPFLISLACYDSPSKIGFCENSCRQQHTSQQTSDENLWILSIEIWDTSREFCQFAFSRIPLLFLFSRRNLTFFFHSWNKKKQRLLHIDPK